MYQINNLEDTIVAVATPVGHGGIGVVRLSGSRAIAIATEFFRAKNQLSLERLKSFRVHYGWVVRKNKNSKMEDWKAGSEEEEIIDEALMTIMRAPKSYTKEDVVEISSHGGIVSLRAILDLATESGARLAEPGEFTKRAFLHGRIDLAQAEAVLDIIQSKTEAFLKVSVNQLKGELSHELATIRDMLMNLYIEMEAIVNFPEDDIDASGRNKLAEQVLQAKEKVDRLLASSEQGRILKEGIKIVLCGKPNVGKSSLLNVLLKHPRAIVSDIAGTTRDTIEETAQIKGIPFQLVDTAGILEPRDLIEEEAVKRSRLYIDSADLALLILDGSRPWTPEDEQLSRHVQNKNVLVVINKTDLPPRLDEQKVHNYFSKERIKKVSVLQKTAIEDLESAIVENVWRGGNPTDSHGIMLSNLRHINALKGGRSCLENAFSHVQAGLSLEFVSEEIKSAVNHLDRITGRNIDADLLENIFSQFCIGK